MARSVKEKEGKRCTQRPFLTEKYITAGAAEIKKIQKYYKQIYVSNSEYL